MQNQSFQERTTNDESSSLKGFLIEIVKFALIAVVVVLPIRIFIAQPFIVKGESMDPTFESGQYLIIDEVSYYMREPERSDVIVFRYPIDPKTYFIKRIIGLPGETVQIKDGKTTIKSKDDPIGFVLSEPYIKRESSDNVTLTLGDEEYFVMGDNRKNSLDSRVWGALPKDNIVGRALVRLYPIHEISLFPGNTVNKQ